MRERTVQLGEASNPCCLDDEDKIENMVDQVFNFEVKNCKSKRRKNSIIGATEKARNKAKKALVEERRIRKIQKSKQMRWEVSHKRMRLSPPSQEFNEDEV